MLFVNAIAVIVHENGSYLFIIINTKVHSLHGSANKNIGDAFLLVWKMPKRLLQIVSNEEYKVFNINIINNLVDVALLSFIKVMIQIRKSTNLDEVKIYFFYFML
jgi:hypothetical protein